jgi:hypothetical protein
VAIPADYNNTKGRTCRYEVVGEYKEDWRSKIDRNESGWNSNLYSSDGGEYDWDEDEDECTYSNGCDENHCFCMDKGYGYKPNGHRFHNVRDKNGRFVRSR